ncbi:uncharacterized protein N7477_002745 [Penicillium maclennaniae]|uniref:uncharacterized protein n=1 Tax=Penicillium maclennaniae TaxID=1343394 RepID=UPI00253FF96C|nr:uncharacterized protein N7477_002745 [Penicillium maclennaniae]KAJ5677112.1 hypothetical protein N7477_002745 [Penicillium maclennaniae]
MRRLLRNAYDVNDAGVTITIEAFTPQQVCVDLLTRHYAAKFQPKGWNVNASCPNLTATNFSRGNERPASESVLNIIRLATLCADGESGMNTDEKGVVP